MSEVSKAACESSPQSTRPRRNSLPYFHAEAASSSSHTRSRSSSSSDGSSATSTASTTTNTSTSVSPPPVNVELNASDATNSISPRPSTSRAHRRERRVVRHPAPLQLDQNQQKQQVLQSIIQQQQEQVRDKPRSSSGSNGSGVKRRGSNASSSGKKKAGKKGLSSSGRLLKSSASAASSPRGAYAESSSTSSSDNGESNSLLSPESSLLRSFTFVPSQSSSAHCSSSSNSSLSSSSSSFSSSSSEGDDADDDGGGKKKRSTGTKGRAKASKEKSTSKSPRSSGGSNSSGTSKKKSTRAGKTSGKKKRKSDETGNKKQTVGQSSSSSSPLLSKKGSEDEEKIAEQSSVGTVMPKDEVHVLLPDLDAVLPEQHGANGPHHRRLSSFSWESVLSKQQMQQFVSAKQRQSLLSSPNSLSPSVYVGNSSGSITSRGRSSSSVGQNMLSTGSISSRGRSCSCAGPTILSYDQLIQSRMLVWVPMGRGTIFSVQNHSLTPSQLFSRRSVPLLVIRSHSLRSLRGRPVCLYCHGTNEDLFSCQMKLQAFAEEHHIDVVAFEYRGYGIRSNCTASFPTVFQDLAVIVSHVLECWDGPFVMYGSQLGAVAVLHFVFTLFSPSRLKIDQRTVLFRGLLAGIICDNMQIATEHMRREAEEYAYLIECPVVLSTFSSDSAVVTSIRMLSMLFHNATFHWDSSAEIPLLSPSSSGRSNFIVDEQDAEGSFDESLGVIFDNVNKISRPLDQFLYLQPSSRLPKIVRCSPEGVIIPSDKPSCGVPPSPTAIPPPLSPQEGVHQKRKEGKDETTKHRHHRSRSHGSETKLVADEALRLQMKSGDEPANVSMANSKCTVTGALLEARNETMREEDKPYQPLRQWLQKRGMDAWYGDFFVSLKLCSVETIAKIPLDSDCIRCYMFLHRIIEDARDTVDLSEISWSEAKSLLTTSAPVIVRPEARRNHVRVPDSVPRAWLNGPTEKSPTINVAASDSGHPGLNICVVSVTPPDGDFFLTPQPPKSQEQEKSRLSVSTTRKRSNSNYESVQTGRLGSSVRSGSPTASSRRPRRNSVFSMEGDDQNLDVSRDYSSRSSKKNTLRRVKQLIFSKVSTPGTEEQ